MRHILLFVGLLAVALGNMQVNAQGTTSQQLQDVVNAAIAEGQPGLVVRLDTPSSHLEGVGGFADVDAEVPMQADDAFRIGSVTKTFTATVILQLSEEGVLNLDDTLDVWLPEVAATLPYGDEITLRQLLSHTSGLFDWGEDAIFTEQYALDPDLRAHQWTSEELVAIAVNHPANFVPGEQYLYCNTGYTLLTMVIEAATGKSLLENYHARILDPLNLSHTYMSDFEAPNSHLVRGYSDLIGTDDYNASLGYGAGGLVSNAADVATFYRALMHGELFRDPATLDAMMTTTEQSKAYVAVNPDETEYGLGMRKFETPLGYAYGHFGDIFGFKAMVIYFPDFDLTMVILTNTEGFAIDFGALLTTVAELVGATS